VTYFLSCGRPHPHGFREELVQSRAGKRPAERLRNRLIAVLERQQIVFQRQERREIVRCEDLALHDREVDLDLIQPARMQRRVQRLQRGLAGLQAGVSLGGPVSRGMVQHPEHAPRRATGLLGHMTSSTRRSSSAMPERRSQRPNRRVLCTSHAARDAPAPWQRYSCSTRKGGLARPASADGGAPALEYSSPHPQR
jgi:hypothetical protein